MANNAAVRDIGKMYLQVKMAKGLRPTDSNSAPDPCCSFSLGEDGISYTTKVLKKTVNPTWNEEFVLDVVDPTQPLVMTITDNSKPDKAVFMGAVTIQMSQFLDQQTKDLWVKIKAKGKKKSKKKLGELRLKVQYIKYSNLVNTIVHPQATLIRALSKITLESRLSAALIAIFKEDKQLDTLVRKIITDEVQLTARASTLFRADSMATKLMREFTRIIGLYWIETVWGPLIQELCNSSVRVEIDPQKLKEGEDPDENIQILKTNTKKFLDAVLGSAKACPGTLREISRHLAETVGQKFPQAKMKAVGGFIFLRFLCPALITPQNYGLVESAPNSATRRQLLLIAKVIQNLANEVLFGQKEVYMEPLNGLIEKYQDKVNSFLEDLASGEPDSEQTSEVTSLPRDVLLLQLDYVVRLISGYMEKLREPLGGHEQLYSLLSAEVEMKFMPLLELQRKQERRIGRPKKTNHKLGRLFK